LHLNSMGCTDSREKNVTIKYGKEYEQVNMLELSLPLSKFSLNEYEITMKKYSRKGILTLEQLNYIFNNEKVFQSSMNERWRNMAKLLFLHKHFYIEKVGFDVDKLMIIGLLYCKATPDERANFLYSIIDPDQTMNLSKVNQRLQQYLSTSLEISCFIVFDLIFSEAPKGILKNINNSEKFKFGKEILLEFLFTKFFPSNDESKLSKIKFIYQLKWQLKEFIDPVAARNSLNKILQSEETLGDPIEERLKTPKNGKKVHFIKEELKSPN